MCMNVLSDPLEGVLRLRPCGRLPWAQEQEKSEGPFALQTPECVGVRASTPGGGP